MYYVIDYEHAVVTKNMFKLKITKWEDHVMSNLIQDAKEQISSILNRACEKAVGKG